MKSEKCEKCGKRTSMYNWVVDKICLDCGDKEDLKEGKE